MSAGDWVDYKGRLDAEGRKYFEYMVREAANHAIHVGVRDKIEEHRKSSQLRAWAVEQAVKSGESGGGILTVAEVLTNFVSAEEQEPTQ